MKLRTRKLSTILRSAAGLLIAIIVASSPATSQDVAAGAEIFKSKCVVCHGPDGSGNTSVGKSLKVADLRSAEIQKKSDAELTQSISDGKNNMPGFKGDLSDDDIHTVLSYVRTLAAKGAAPKKK
jgi:cytochrome c6